MKSHFNDLKITSIECPDVIVFLQVKSLNIGAINKYSLFIALMFFRAFDSVVCLFITWDMDKRQDDRRNRGWCDSAQVSAHPNL